MAANSVVDVEMTVENGARKHGVGVIVVVATLQSLTDEIISFRDERNWAQFHTLKNLIVSLNIEASELLEIAQWMDETELKNAITKPDVATAVSDECADVFIYLLLICNGCGINLIQVARDKLVKNAKKYPVEMAYGSSKKYTDL
jgi:NTP pyrophosphatase (non-canonical NTP hydrolase)